MERFSEKNTKINKTINNWLLKSKECAFLDVYKENIKLYKYNLVIQNFGNVSARNGNICLIKPSGIDFQDLKENQIVEIDITCGKYKGVFAPSTDTPTHIEIYRKYISNI